MTRLYADADAARRALAAHAPSRQGTLRMDFVAGRLVRHKVRHALNLARINGAEVEHYEERGFLESSFSIKITGTVAVLASTLDRLSEVGI